MLLANPIYDTVFKYLLEDLELARGLLAEIIGEEIVEITTQANETANKLGKYELHVLRLDFKVVVVTKEGIRKKILIELQKAQQLGDIMRFRKYLGNNYLKKDSFPANFQAPDGLPIITIYFLGFRLKKVLTPVLKVNRVYMDMITNKPLQAKEEFVEKLTHDSYIIQIPRLQSEVRNDLERVLTIFNQSYRTSDSKVLQLQEEDLGNNELLEKLVWRLRSAVSDEKLMDEWELEEYYTRILDDAHRKVLINEEKIELANEQIKEANQKAEQFEEKAQQFEEQAQQLEEKARLAEEKYAALLAQVQQVPKTAAEEE